jgi:DNA repair protein RadA/Sms
MAVGGARVHEPSADLPLALAVVSSFVDRPIPSDVVACGEVGLGGELRSVAGLDRRLAEAARLGFRRAVVPMSTPDIDAQIAVTRVETLGDALSLLHLVSDR